MSKPRVCIVVEMPGGHDGFQSAREAKEFIGSALRTEAILRYGQHPPSWGYEDSHWYVRLKDLRKVIQADRIKQADRK